jgi:D-alanyl-D-alanine carboxypeptidase (penicillin-binding protein 5/6)
LYKQMVRGEEYKVRRMGKEIKRWTAFCLGVSIFIAFISFYEVHAEHAAPIGTNAQASTLIDVESGRILVSHHGDEKMLIASLTKIMTAIVAIENGNLSERVKVSERAYRKEGSSIYLHLHEEMNLEHMLYGLMLRSGNDAATAIAEHVGGSEEGFAYLMNEKAKAIGMLNSNFVNPHGLNAEDHYSTSNDMAILTAYALRNPLFNEIVKTKVKKVPNPHEKWDYTWYNKNKMLSMYKDGDGVKTGYTKKAGRCLVSSATREGRQLAVVTLNDPNDWLDHTQWLNYGFTHYSQRSLIEKGDPIDGQPYVAGRTLYYPLAKDEESVLTTKMKLIDINSVHYRLGERGTLQFILEDQMIGSVPIYEEQSPQLKLNHKPAFLFSESPSFKDTKEQYYSVLQTVLRALFNG